MGYNFAAPTNRYALKRQAPLTQGAQQAEAQNNKGLATGQFADVQSAQGATDRANAMRTSQGLQASRGTVGRSGDFSPEAALRAQDQAMAASGAQNLNATNSVNQLQRQYRNDAMNRSADFEANAQKGAAAERDYKTGADNQDYGRNLEARNYGDNRGDVRFGQGMAQKTFNAGRQDRAQDVGYRNQQAGEDSRRFDVNQGNAEKGLAMQDRQFNMNFGANREDAGTAKNQFSQNFGASRQDRAQDVDYRNKQYGDSRSDVMYGRNTEQSRYQDSRGDQAYSQAEDKRRYDQTFGASRSDAADNRGRFDLARQDANSQFAQNYNANRADAADSRGRFDLSRQDQNNQFNQNYNANRSDAADNRSRFDISRQDQNYQFDQNFSASRADAADNRSRFDLSRQDTKDQQGVQNQQWETTNAQGENRFNLSRQDQNSQFDRTFGANREDRNQDVEYRNDQANTQKDQWGMSFNADRQDRAQDVDYRNDQANTQKDQWGQTFGASREDAATQRDQFGVSSRQNEQQINNQASQFNLSRQDQNSQFGVTSGQNQQQINNQTSQFNLARQDDRGDVAYDRENAGRLEGKGDAMAAINSIQDPKAKAAAMQMYTNGEPIRDILSKIQTNGTINDGSNGTTNFRSDSPGVAAYNAKVDTLKSYYPKNSDESDSDYNNRIALQAQTERKQELDISNIPINKAKLQQELDVIKSTIDNGKPLDPKSGDFEKAITAGLVRSVFANEQGKINDPANMGKPIVIDKQNYTVTKQGRTRTYGGDYSHSPRHTEYSELQDGNGKKVYSYGGTLHDSPPKEVPLAATGSGFTPFW